jgi:hypothetical protein
MKSCHYNINVSCQDPIVGGSLLLTYTTGYVAPLLIAASFAGALQVYPQKLLSADKILPAKFNFE